MDLEDIALVPPDTDADRYPWADHQTVPAYDPTNLGHSCYDRSTHHYCGYWVKCQRRLRKCVAPPFFDKTPSTLLTRRVPHSQLSPHRPFGNQDGTSNRRQKKLDDARSAVRDT